MALFSNTYQSNRPFLHWSKFLLLNTQSTLAGLNTEGHITRDRPQKHRGAEETDSRFRFQKWLSKSPTWAARVAVASAVIGSPANGEPPAD